MVSSAADGVLFDPVTRVALNANSEIPPTESVVFRTLCACRDTMRPLTKNARGVDDNDTNLSDGR